MLKFGRLCLHGRTMPILFFFSARCGSAGSPTKRNAMEPKRRRKMKLPFGTSTTLSDQETQGAGKILILCPADRNPSKKNQIVQIVHSVRFVAICLISREAHFLISFGASTPLSNRSTQPPINCRNVARRVSTISELNIMPIKKEVLPPP